jgi:leucyl aminopeptidase (aminopeptidase T)
MAQDSVSSATRAKVARSVLTNNLGVKPGERVIIEAWSHTLPWAVSLAREARRLGAQPLIPYEDEAAFWDVVDEDGEQALGTVPAHEWAALAKTNVYIHMWGPGDRIRLNQLSQKRRDVLFGFNSRWYQAATKAGLRGARLELGRVYPSLAKAYGVSESAWTDQLVRGTLVPPEVMRRRAAPLARALERGKRLRIRDDAGTDLTLGLARRPARVQIGRLSAADLKRPSGSLMTLPSGGLRVALDETVADGTIIGNRTNYFDNGVATGGVFRFRNGRLTDHEFARGQRFFDADYKLGGKGRDRPGQFSIGLNPQLHNTPQLEDGELGALMVSVGMNRFSGGKNPSPFFGWVINAGASVEVDGRTIWPGS